MSRNEAASDAQIVQIRKATEDQPGTSQINRRMSRNEAADVARFVQRRKQQKVD